MIDVVYEQVQGMNPLLQTAFEVLPLIGRNNPGDQVERKNSLLPGGISVYVERDSHLQQQSLGGVLVSQKLAVGQRLDRLQQQPAVRPRMAAVFEHLVVEAVCVVCGELHGCTSPVFMFAQGRGEREAEIFYRLDSAF